MPIKDIHTKPFDAATVSKLEIFEQYLESWLPVFIQSSRYRRVIICDFFAGSGYDTQGCPGSPLRILSMLEKHRDKIIQKRLEIRVVFNDLKSDKANQLESLLASKADEIKSGFGGLVSFECHSDEFRKLFDDLYEDFKQQAQANLIFLDQNGIKQINDAVFKQLITLHTTDFLFFISSSYLRRFAGESSFITYFPDLNPDLIRNARHEDAHRVILDYYKAKIPPENHTRLYPFSFKKGSNIYGLVFGSKHQLGVEKFLNIVWDKNKLNGEADFDIDGDIEKQIPSLFPELQKPTKLKMFEQKLEAYVLSRKELTNCDLFDFALANGHVPRHARSAILRMRKDGKVECDGRIGCSFKSCYRDKKVKQIKVVGNG